MKCLAAICASSVLLIPLSACSVQNVLNGLSAKHADPQQIQQPLPVSTTQPEKSVHHGAKSDAKNKPTDEAVVEYIRGKLLVLSPSDNINDNLDVTYDPATSGLTITEPNGRCEQFLNALDANSLSWDLFDPGDARSPREELLRLTISSSSGRIARTCYDKENHPDKTVTTNRARFLFARWKVEQFPGFQDKMTKAMKQLIVSTGGAPEKEIFASH